MNNRIDPATSSYIQMVNAIPRLRLEQELELAARFQRSGDRAAAEQVIRTNLRHVVPHALRYGGRGPALQDMIAQGNLALITALDRFDPSRGFRFVTYANHWIRSEILSLVLKTRTMVGGGRGHQHGRYVFRLQKEHAQLTTKLGASEEVYRVLADRFGRSEAQIVDILARLKRGDGSLDTQAADSTCSWAEQLPCDGEQPDAAVEQDRMRDDVASAVHQATTDLDERERVIVEQRLMADEGDRLTLVEVGRRFGVSRERARQLEVRVKDKLRRRLGAVAGRWELGAAAA